MKEIYRASPWFAVSCGGKEPRVVFELDNDAEAIETAQARKLAIAILEETGGLPGTHAAFERGYKAGSGEAP